MANKDIVHALKPITALDPALRTGNATTNGTDIDRAQAGSTFEALAFYVQTGLRTDGSVAYKLQHAPDNGSGAPGAYADVTPATDQIGAFVPFAGAGDQSKILNEVGYIGSLRWVRLVSTGSGQTTGATWGAVAVLGFPRNLPQ